MSESWFTIEPETGEVIEVMYASRVEIALAIALASASDAVGRADVFREAAARVRVMLRRLDAPDSTPGSQATALEEIRAAVDHMAKGMPQSEARAFTTKGEQ